MSLGLYLAGFAILIGGLSYGAYLAHVPTQWIVVGVIVLVGIGVLKGVSHTRMRDPS